MDQENSGIFGERHSTATVREILLKYLRYWPLFLVCIALCVSAGVIYTRYTAPKYTAATSFLIKGSEGNYNSGDLIESVLNGKKEVNLNNDMLLISSAGLMERTVARNNFNVIYIKKGKIRDIDIYKDAPFALTALQLSDSNRTYSIYIKKIDPRGGSYLYGPENAERLSTFRWKEPFSIGPQSFVLVPKTTIQTGDGEYIVKWEPVETSAAGFSNDLTVKAYDTKSSVVQLSIKTDNALKSKDILNALFKEFNLADMEDLNKLSESTVKFIDDRLVNISRELKGVEGNLENYQGSNQLIDVKGQTTQSLENSNEASKTIKNISIQKSVASMILEYFANPANSSMLAPSSLGLNDATLSSLITQYNELQLKKERETPLVAPRSTVMQDLNTQITNLKSSILESLKNINSNLQLQQNNFRQQNNQYQSSLSSMPHNERVLQEIKRKQSITEGLYLYLLQKREEAAISSTASSIPHYKQLDLATAFGAPEPNAKNIIIYSALLGCFLAWSYIYFRDLLDDKITSKEDIINRSSLPLTGQISRASKLKKQGVSVLDRSLMGEQFRALRTSLSFQLKDKDKSIILVTSSSKGEGKCFISLNLAAVFAITGKKVALLKFDLRQTDISMDLNEETARGITDFLSGKADNINQIMQVSNDIPSLHIYPSGSAAVNPGDLLLTGNMYRLFESLKAEYDYIIIDTPPAGLVSDAFILGEYSDMALFILRSRKTTKKQLDFVKELVDNKFLRNVNLILNDINKAGNYGYDDDYI